MNCLDNLDKCHAKCCRVFVLEQEGGWNVKKGDMVTFQGNIPANMLWYYQLHGARLLRGRLTFKLNEFKTEGNKLFVYYTCKALMNNGKCTIHERKPSICTALGERDFDYSRIYLTENCIYRGNTDGKPTTEGNIHN